MSAYEDPLLAARFAALAPERLPGDWDDVLDRAGRARKGGRRFADSLPPGRRRRLLVLAVVALLVVVGTASALGIRALLGHGIVGLAPEGATPSTPTSGQLVLRFMFGHTMGDPGRFLVDVYADGRMIWSRNGDYSRTDEYRSSTGWLERRLTPYGVELVMAEVRSSGLVDHDLDLRGAVEGLYFGSIDFRTGDRVVHVTWRDPLDPEWRKASTPTPDQARALVRLDERLEDPASWLPASAWEDPDIRAYVPAEYSVCLAGQKGLELPRVLALLPERAENVLRAHENAPNHYTNLVGTFVMWCSRLTNDEARALDRILTEAGLSGRKSEFGLHYGSFDPARFGPKDFLLEFSPIFPDQVGSR